MKFSKIVGFGDSWMWGDELIDPQLRDRVDAHPVLESNTPYRQSHCFLGLLGQHYQVPVENFGIAGGSVQSAIWTYLYWLEHEELDVNRCLILVAHTDGRRFSHYNPHHAWAKNDPPWNKFVHSSWVWSGNSVYNDNWNTLIKNQTALTTSVELDQLNYRHAVEFFHGQSHEKMLLQFCSMPPQIHLDKKSLIWPDQGLGQRLRERDDRALFAPNGHPSELGHKVIAEDLISEVDRVIITR